MHYDNVEGQLDHLRGTVAYLTRKRDWLAQVRVAVGSMVGGGYWKRIEQLHKVPPPSEGSEEVVLEAFPAVKQCLEVPFEDGDGRMCDGCLELLLDEAAHVDLLTLLEEVYSDVSTTSSPDAAALLAKIALLDAEIDAEWSVAREALRLQQLSRTDDQGLVVVKVLDYQALVNVVKQFEGRRDANLRICRNVLRVAEEKCGGLVGADLFDGFGDMVEKSEGGALLGDEAGVLGSGETNVLPRQTAPDAPPRAELDAWLSDGEAAADKLEDLLRVGCENLNADGLETVVVAAVTIRNCWRRLVRRHNALRRIEDVIHDYDPDYVVIQSKAEADSEMLREVEEENRGLGSLAGSTTGAPVRVSGNRWERERFGLRDEPEEHEVLGVTP